MSKKTSTARVSVMLFKSITIILGLITTGLGWTAILNAKEIPHFDGESIHIQVESEKILTERRVLEENIFLLTTTTVLIACVVNISFEFMTDALRKGWRATMDKMYHVIAGIFLCLGNFLLIHAAKMQHNFYTNDFDTPVDSETWKDIVRQSINYTPKLVAGSIGIVNGLACLLGGILIFRSGLHSPQAFNNSPHSLHL